MVSTQPATKKPAVCWALRVSIAAAFMTTAFVLLSQCPGRSSERLGHRYSSL